MNWKMTRPQHEVIFEANEPFAMLTPVRRGDIERFQPEIRLLSDDPDLESGYYAWSRSRTEFNKGLKVEGSEARKSRWQKHYMRGETVSQRKGQEHQTGLALQEFIDKRK